MTPLELAHKLRRMEAWKALNKMEKVIGVKNAVRERDATQI